VADAEVLDTAVALFVFNRPEHTRRVIERIERARPARVLVIADGPRAGEAEDDRRCDEVRSIVDAVSWPCDVAKLYSDVNLGCTRRVVTGLDWVFANCDDAIILEDDCVPDASFFPFCSELLDRYRDDERVHMVSGTNVLPPGAFEIPHSYYYSRSFQIWGWATWARAWKHYDIEMRDWPELRASGWLERFLPEHAMAEVADAIFEETYQGRVEAWDYQWVLSGWSRGALSITPAANLVTNIGYGGDASHTRDANHPLANRPTVPMSFPLRHPEQLEVHEGADRRVWAAAYPEYFATGRGQARPRSLIRRIRTGLRSTPS
jgi:hypothetical protein